MKKNNTSVQNTIVRENINNSNYNEQESEYDPQQTNGSRGTKTSIDGIIVHAIPLASGQKPFKKSSNMQSTFSTSTRPTNAMNQN